MRIDERTTPTVSWEAPDQGEWALEIAHGSALSPVVYRVLTTGPFAEGTRRGLEPFGLPLSHAELRFVNGWPYFSFFVHDAPRSGGKPPPAWVLKAITRLHPGFRRRTKMARAAIEQRRAERMATEWFAERSSWIARILTLQRVPLDDLDLGELTDHLEAATSLAVESVTRHFELIFASIPLGRWFLQAERWGLPAHEARAAVMHSTPVHDEARARLAAITEALGSTQPNDLVAVRNHSAAAAAALDDYLEHHGGWAAADSITERTMAEHPHAVITAIETHAESRGEAPARDAAATLARLRDLVPTSEQRGFDRLAADAHETHKMLDDNSGILASWPSGLVSTVLRTLADRLVANGQVDDPQHLWALSMDEVIAVARGTSSMGAADIAAVHADWLALAELDPPPHLGAEPSEPPDPSVFPAPVGELMASFFAFFEDKFNENGDAVGIGDGPIEGRAIVAEDSSEALDRLTPGDILVTTATTPAYNTVLGIAGGVVVAEGGASSHTAVVARELGVTAIVGYSEALAIPDGALVRLDPAAATVTVLSRT